MEAEYVISTNHVWAIEQYQLCSMSWVIFDALNVLTPTPLQGVIRGITARIVLVSPLSFATTIA